MSKTRVGVLRGGPSSEYDISLKTGANVIKNLPEDYEPIDIFIDREGRWHVRGICVEPHKALQAHKVDIVFNALHGEYGEDGQVQHLMDSIGIPYTGSGKVSSAFAMQKGHAKNALKKLGIKTPYHKVVEKNDATNSTIIEWFRTFPNPSVVKPSSLGSSIGVSISTNFSEFQNALERAFACSPTVIIEEFIKGREATCGVIDDFRGEQTYALLPVEIVLADSSPFFDYEAKYGGKSRTIHPGRFSEKEKKAIQNYAKAVHFALGLRHYSRSDFIVSYSRGVYFLEVNSLPDLASDSPYIGSLGAVGASFPDFLDHVLQLALNNR